MLIALIVLVLLFFWIRPLERWEGSITARANESKVPREIVLVLDLASFPLMMVVMFGLPSAIVLVPPGSVGNALGFKDIFTEMVFWAFCGGFAYVSISIARILISTAWYFFGFGAIGLYKMSGWKAVPMYILIPFVILGPVTKATNMLLTSSLGGLLSSIKGEINYTPILFFLTLFNVAMVVNGVMKAPSQGQYMLTYFAAMFEAVTQTHVSAVFTNAAAGRLIELPVLKELGDEYQEVKMSEARKVLEQAAGRGARNLGRFLVKDKKGNYALSPEAKDVVEVNTDGNVKL